MQIPKLVIGNRNYSSWSFRAWLLMAKLDLHFDEVRVPLSTPGSRDALRHYSPAGRVPVYIEGARVIWDSLAIAEYLAERHPRLWPTDDTERAHARSISAEMHSGFMALRGAMPMNCRATGRRVDMTPQLENEIARIRQIWTTCRQAAGERGPWLFGTFTIADAMFAPVVSRFHTYGVICDGEAEAYMTTVLDDSDVQRWYALSRKEKEVIEKEEVGHVEQEI